MYGSSIIHAAGVGQIGNGFRIMASAKVLLDAFCLLLPLILGVGFSWINVVFIFNCLKG